jgi:tetratricopeptide (TPR) repeat protein
VAALTVSACAPAPQEAVPPAEAIAQARRLDLDGRHAEAVAMYRETLERVPDSFDAQYGIARALDLVDRYEEAQEHFARAIELAPDGVKDQALRMMGLSQTFARDPAAAATYFEQVFDRRQAAGNFAGAADVANELGRVHLELGDPDDAARWYRLGNETAARQDGRSAAQIDLTEFRWAHAQARIAARRGDEAEARRQEAVVRALLDKGSNQDQQVHVPYLRGYIEFHLGNYEGAVAALRDADQEDPFILMLLGQALERAGQTEDAQRYYRDVLASASHAVTNAIARPVARQNVEPVAGASR